MNKYRERAINNLIVVLHETRNAFLHGARGCCFECRSIMYGALTLQMQSVKLLSPKPEAPFPDLSYNYLVRMAMAFTSPAWHDRSSPRAIRDTDPTISTAAPMPPLRPYSIC